MDLMTNCTFRIMPMAKATTAYPPGVYRVILDDIRGNTTVATLIHRDEGTQKSLGGRSKSELREGKKKKSPMPLVGGLMWMNRTELLELHNTQSAGPITLEHETRAITSILSPTAKSQYERRLATMASFLDLESLHEGITVHHGLGGLVRSAMAVGDCSSAFVYKLWSLLCRYGLQGESLRPRHHLCGAPGIGRPVSPTDRKKAGRKTSAQRVALAFGRAIDSAQPGMSIEWRAAILAADSTIPAPKPRWSTRYTEIVRSAFVGRAQEKDGVVTFVRPEVGSYPNEAQVRRVLTVSKTRLERVMERTTLHHFTSARRGLVGRNWEGVSGPGHTWAIDSTVGDIYLRSSICRSWIIGRPIVYIIVDVWSTAVVGFYVCLSGPSWATAKVALFNSIIGPEMLGEFWRHEAITTLRPQPTICYSLMCDRGEYLSQLHQETALKLLSHTGYAPPYRGDLKGLVEVLHRIEKDAQFQFVPGAMDYRREELEMRKVDPQSAVLTLQEYVKFLNFTFAEYNLTADRRHRVDVHMEAAGVYPSPAGLWAWGHQMGIGFRRHTSESDLITQLLPKAVARVRRDGVKFWEGYYLSDSVKSEQWTAIARNLGGWDIPIHHYPGTRSTVWTPNQNGAGLLRLHLTPESRVVGEASFDENLDPLALSTIRQPDVAHQNAMQSVEFRRLQKQAIDEAKRRTAAALKADGGSIPTIREARAMERLTDNVLKVPSARTEPQPSESSGSNESSLIHEKTLRALLASMSVEELDHGKP